MKNRFLSMLIGAVLFVLSVAAENYPYRSDVLWVTVPDHADWLYKTGEKAKIEVQFYKYGIPQDGVEVLYELGGDMMPSDTKGTVKLKNGKAVISMGRQQHQITGKIDTACPRTTSPSSLAAGNLHTFKWQMILFGQGR